MLGSDTQDQMKFVLSGTLNKDDGWNFGVVTDVMGKQFGADEHEVVAALRELGARIVLRP